MPRASRENTSGAIALTAAKERTASGAKPRFGAALWRGEAVTFVRAAGGRRVDLRFCRCRGEPPACARRSRGARANRYARRPPASRPSFITAAPPELARALYDEFCEALRQLGVSVATGIFQSMMSVELVNEGPVTILLDSDNTF